MPKKTSTKARAKPRSRVVPPVVKPAVASRVPATPVVVPATSIKAPTATTGFESLILAGPPAVTIPVAPKVFQPSSMRAYMGYRPTSSEVHAARGAIEDLGRFSSYAATLGSTLPAASLVANALSLALTWRALRAPLEALNVYVKLGDAEAWKAALTLVEDMKAHLLRAMEKDGRLALEYPSLALLAGTAKETAKRANVTKKKRAKSKAEAAQKAAVEVATDDAKAEATAKPASKGVTINA
jgi:hypothetical protein